MSLTDPLDLLEGLGTGLLETEAVPENAEDDVGDTLEEDEADEEDVPAGAVCEEERISTGS